MHAMGIVDITLYFGLSTFLGMTYGYTLLESTQIVEGKCKHEGKLMEHDEVIRKDDPCESYQCDTQRKMILVNLCHYGLNQRAPPDCVLRKRTGDFPACCPWPDCSEAGNVERRGSSPGNGTTTGEALTDGADDLIVPASQGAVEKPDLHATPAAASESSVDELRSTATSAPVSYERTTESEAEPSTGSVEAAS